MTSRDGQIVIGHDIGHGQHLVQHLAMLAGGNHRHAQAGLPAQGSDDREQLDRLGPRAEDDRHMAAGLFFPFHVRHAHYPLFQPVQTAF